MGATVTTGKRAAAFTAPSGQNIYVLFEQTYEKNCTPHSPHWNCILFGDISAQLWSASSAMRPLARAVCCRDAAEVSHRKDIFVAG